MHLFSIIYSYFTSFHWNIPLALFLLAIYAFFVYLGYLAQAGFSMRINCKVLPILLALFWLYGELRTSGMILYPYDKEDFLFNSTSAIGLVIVVVASALLIGSILHLLIKK